MRGLLDNGVLEKRDDGALHLVGELGELGELEIPPGLTALIASRLDALEADERRLVKECSVLGTSFPRQAIEAVSDTEPESLDKLLSSLVRKEVLTVRADKLSPERGQYAFTQSLIRSVSYDMLTRAERKVRHLRTAEHLRSAFPEEGAEVAEVIASHLHDAYKAAGDSPEAAELRARACRAYELAAERANSVGAPQAAESAYLLAAELSSDDAEQARFVEGAGRMAKDAGWSERALGHFETAIAAHAAAGRDVDAARVTGRLGTLLSTLGQGELAITTIREALASLRATTAPPELVADIQARLGHILVFSGHAEDAAVALEEALTLAQHHGLAETLANALDWKASYFSFAGRNDEAGALYELAIAVARRNGISRVEMRSESNLANLCVICDLPGAEDHAKAALALARRWGVRQSEAHAASCLMDILIMGGRLDEAERLGTELLRAGGDERQGAEGIYSGLSYVEVLRGNVEGARQYLSGCGAWAESDDVQDRAMHTAAEAAVSLAEGESRRALETARSAIDEAIGGGLGVGHDAVRLAFPTALEAAIDVGDLEEAGRLVELLAMCPRCAVPPFLQAQVPRAKALVAGARGDGETVEENLVAAETAFRDLGYPYWTARTQLDRAEWLARQGRLDESASLASEAAVTFETVGATPMAARARALLKPEMVRAPGAGGERAVAQRRPSLSE